MKRIDDRAAIRLGKDLAPVVAEELRHVERIVANARGGATSATTKSAGYPFGNNPGQISEAQLDELAKRLDEETRELERRWSTASSALVAPTGPEFMPPTPCLPGVTQQTPAQLEEQQAQSLESQFREGKVEDAFIKGIGLQLKAQHVDMLGRLCNLVENPDGWLSDIEPKPLGSKTQMLLMMSLAKQLSSPIAAMESRAGKAYWIIHVLVNFDSMDPSVAENVTPLYAALTEALEKIPSPDNLGDLSAFKQLRMLFKSHQKLMGKRLAGGLHNLE